MKRACLYFAGIFALSPFALGQTVVLYEENFPNAGQIADIPVSNVGWANDIPAGINSNRLAIGDAETGFGLVWAFEPAPGAGATNTTAFYSSTALDTGATGPAFTNITPSAYSNIELRVRIRDRWDTDNMATRFAVQIDGANWFVSTNELPVPESNNLFGGTWVYYVQVFTTSATDWRSLTVSGNGTGTGAVIGATASSDLTGQITGAGVVVQHWIDGGTHEFDDFQVRATPFSAIGPSIDEDPVSRTVYETENVTLSVTASGTAPLSYKWREGGSPLTDIGNISGTTTDQLIFTSVTLANAGSYDVVVSNSVGAVTSAVATLTVNSIPADLIYEESFPWLGSGFISSVGWTNAIAAELARMYEFPGGSGDGNVYAYEPGAATTAFYTATALDNGISGLPFDAIDPDAYPFVTLEVEITPSFNPANVAARMAVQMSAGAAVTTTGEVTSISISSNTVQVGWDGGPDVTLQRAQNMGGASWTNVPGTTGQNMITAPAADPESYFRTSVPLSTSRWFVSASPLPVNPNLGIATQHLEFVRTAAVWNDLTIGATSATIGGAASNDLEGDIIGAGVVFVHSGAGTFDFDNFRITTNEAPTVPPQIVWLPQSFTAYEGAGVSFAVAASGTVPFTYEWSKDFVVMTDGGRVSGSTTDVVTVTDIVFGDAGEYSVQVSNDAGSDDSFFLQIHSLAVAPVPAGLLYAEQFPFVGPGAASKPLGLVGWASDVPSAADRLFKISGEGTNDGAGAVFAFENGAATSAFYTRSDLDTGVSGLPFTPLAFGTTYTNLDLAVDIAPSFTASNVTARFAVQIDSSGWYVSTSALPVPTGADSDAYGSYTQQVTTASAGWNELTLTGFGAVIGGGATNNLTGSLTGAGVVISHTGQGTFNIDNFEIQE